MDFINKIMNIVIPPISLTLLLLVLPPYLFFKYLFITIRPIFTEDILGKVILITGASSGIGEVINQTQKKILVLNLLGHTEMNGVRFLEIFLLIYEILLYG